MIADWKRPKGDDTSNKSKEVNLFNTDIEILKNHYLNVLGLHGLEKETLPNEIEQPKNKELEDEN
jgi:hypothetical protein